MNLKYLTICILVLSLMVAGCTLKNEPGVSSPYKGGSEGLISQFEEVGSLISQSGLPEIWEDQGIPVVVRVSNRGEYTVPAGMVQFVIKGIKIPEDFQGVEPVKTNSKEIEKVSEYLPDGGEELVDFGEAFYVSGVKGTFYDANVFVEYTYPYEQTIVVPKVCFKGNPYDNTICNIDEGKQGFISGGPLQIGTVVQRPAGKGRISLEIPIRNVGGGKAKASDSTFEEFSPMYDEVLMQVPDGWECTAKGTGDLVRITRNGETVIRCKYGFLNPIAEKDIYTSTFDLKLTYIYWDFVSQTVRIRENPELK
ncbi:hypothetical protein HY636_00905 [Candidatus Woesearchaeota archaeon]|nr:hypothetical protein [Candidatus Woesearchaeota archaeon]